MESVEQILKTIFGGQVTVDGILSVCVSIYAVVMSFGNILIKKKLIMSDKTLSTTDAKVQAMSNETEDLKKQISILGNLVVTAFLSSNNIDITVKQKITEFSGMLNKLSGFELTEFTSKLVDAIANKIPESNLADKKESIIADAKIIEDIIDSATEDANSVIDKLPV